MEAKQFKLKWNNFQKNLLHQFESMQNNEELADVTLTCEGINVKAHKFILSACSPYFRTIFKENPCSHPIVILKDIYYVDLIAIVNYMYHGEVMVSEDNLSTFLDTAAILQVSGLSNGKRTHYIKNKQRKDKASNDWSTDAKRIKKTSINTSPISTLGGYISSPKEERFEVKQEKTDLTLVLEDQIQKDVERVIEDQSVEKSETSSILEAVLELKDKPCGSILERSLTSTPSLFPKIGFIPRKPPEEESEMQLARSPPESLSPTEIIQHTVKSENDDLYEMIEITSPEDVHYYQTMKNIEVQPHHSSQCGNCPHCGKGYSNQSALKYHVRLVHSDLTNMFCCHLCPESFDFREGYKKHMADIHLLRN